MIPIADGYTDWYIGFALAFIIVVVVVIIVGTILTLAQRISQQARGAAAGVDTVRAQTTSLTSGVGQVNDSAIRILHMARVLRKAATGT
jgi:X-X-X-Leu-X-X-Gly heptad repeat protein